MLFFFFSFFFSPSLSKDLLVWWLLRFVNFMRSGITKEVASRHVFGIFQILFTVVGRLITMGLAIPCGDAEYAFIVSVSWLQIQALSSYSLSSSMAMHHPLSCESESTLSPWSYFPYSSVSWWQEERLRQTVSAAANQKSFSQSCWWVTGNSYHAHQS